MNCEEAQKLNASFLNGDIEFKYLEDYLRHIESCKTCYEELDIMNIVMKGLDSADGDDDGNYNFPELLNKRIDESKLYLKARYRRNRILFYSLCAVGFIIVAVVVLLFMFF